MGVKINYQVNGIFSTINTCSKDLEDTQKTRGDF